MNLTNTLALSERKGTYTHTKKKITSLLTTPFHFETTKPKAETFIPPQNIPSMPMNFIPPLLLDERIACIWTTVRMPIVHFSVLLVFKKFATHNTEHFQIQCAVTQPSKPLPTHLPAPTPNLAEHRSGISKVRKYILSKLSTEKKDSTVSE